MAEAAEVKTEEKVAEVTKPQLLGTGIANQTYLSLKTVYKDAGGVEQTNVSKFPQFGLGTWLSKAGEVEQSVEWAIDEGYRHVDAALCYGNEKEVGIGLKRAFDKGAVKREDLFVTSKLWNTDHKGVDVEPALRETLEDLGLEYLDLYLIHWPMCFKRRLGDTGTGTRFPKEGDIMLYGEIVPHKETWAAMEALVKKGLVKHIGFSNFSEKQMEDIMSTAEIMPRALQCESHPYFQQKPLIEFCRKHEMAFTCYSPLGNRTRPWATEEENAKYNVFTNEVIAKVAAAHKKTNAQVCIRWQIERGLVVIPKSVHKERIIQNSQVFDFQLTAEEMAAIESVDCGFRSCVVLMKHADGRMAPRDIVHPQFPFVDEFPAAE